MFQPKENRILDYPKSPFKMMKYAVNMSLKQGKRKQTLRIIRNSHAIVASQLLSSSVAQDTSYCLILLKISSEGLRLLLM